MAKETKSERKERELVENKVAFLSATEKYTLRLLNLVVNVAVINDNAITVKRGSNANEYIFYCRIHYLSVVLLPAVMTTWEHFYDLERVEDSIREYYAEIEEDKRKYAVKTAALAKLNPEELELLGLK